MNEGEARATAEPLSGPATRELAAALALVRAPGLGPVRIRRMVDARGSATAALEAFRRLEPVPPAAGERPARPYRLALRRALERLAPAAPSELETLAARRIRLRLYGAPAYPERLTHLRDPPILLFLLGPGRLRGRPAVTIVGTRRATSYGRRMARDLATGFVALGWTVVSGMALGIDAAAHRGALDAEGGTIGVLGAGFDHAAPAGDPRLHRAMRRRALLVSEMEPAEPPGAGSYPRRNRILAALADAVVVVQAGRRSGASITVGHALDLGREVFAVPGPVGPEASAGVHRMIRDGAGLVTCVGDVLRGLGVETPAGGPAGAIAQVDAGTAGASEGTATPVGEEPPEAAAALFRRLAEGPAGLDELVARCGLSVGETRALLCRLELAGRVEGRSGARFALPTGTGGAGPSSSA